MIIKAVNFQMTEKNKIKLYSQTQIAKELKVSQATITRLLKGSGIQPEKVEGKAKLYSQSQVDKIRLLFLRKKERNADDDYLNNISSFLRKEIETLHDENEKIEEKYTEQLKVKDKQIDDLNERLKEAHQLQLGLEQKLKMLPSKSNENNLVEGEAVENKKNPEEPKKGFWSRLFKI